MTRSQEEGRKVKLIIDPTLETSQPKAGRAYSTLRAAIIGMRIKPGQILNEKEICTGLDISRTPFREAILRLATEKLVRIVPSDATYVNQIAVQDVIDGYLIRQTLELRLLALATQHYQGGYDAEFELLLFQQRGASQRNDVEGFCMFDNAFHHTLCKAAGFAQVWDTIRNATGQLDRIRHYALTQPGQLEEAVSEHAQIHTALQSRDSARANALMTKHQEDILRATLKAVDVLNETPLEAELLARLKSLLT